MSSLVEQPSYSEYSHDRLGFTFCLALALHAALILGVSFNFEVHSVAAPKLDITLAQHRSERAPDKADFLAQNNQEGSGTLKKKAMLTTRETADYHDTTIRKVTPRQQVHASRVQAAQNRLLTTRGESTRHVPQHRNKQQQEAQTPALSHDPLNIQRSLEIASLEAKLEVEEQAYAKRPRIRRLTSVATKRSGDALYLHNWREKIEAIGNLNYPEKARRQHIYGSLRLLVSLLPNGAVYKVKILESSGHPTLDQAAIRIVHLAAPFEPFPKKMKSQVDVLEIIRTWRFHKDRLTSGS